MIYSFRRSFREVNFWETLDVISRDSGKLVPVGRRTSFSESYLWRHEVFLGNKLSTKAVITVTCYSITIVWECVTMTQASSTRIRFCLKKGDFFLRFGLPSLARVWWKRSQRIFFLKKKRSPEWRFKTPYCRRCSSPCWQMKRTYVKALDPVSPARDKTSNFMCFKWADYSTVENAYFLTDNKAYWVAIMTSYWNFTSSLTSLLFSTYFHSMRLIKSLLVS